MMISRVNRKSQNPLRMTRFYESMHVRAPKLFEEDEFQRGGGEGNNSRKRVESRWKLEVEETLGYEK